MGLRIAGVDMLESHEGPQILEVNSSPGLEGIEGATGVDVAGAVIEYIEDRVALPDMDLRQRLTVTRGFGVAEVPVPQRSRLVGQTLAALDFRSQDILVLSLHRGKKIINNPHESRKLRVGDRLLCYGRLERLKTLIPPRRKRRFRKLPKTIYREAVRATEDG
jgi:ribosomal protein S6--L-glutamate ligase